MTQRSGASRCPKRLPASTAPCASRGSTTTRRRGCTTNVMRYYEPSTARYLTGDPLGLAAGPNPHAYVANPMHWTDTLGLSPYRTVDELRDVIVDTNAVFNRRGVEAALRSGENPVITRTTAAELKNLVARRSMKMPRFAGELSVIDDALDINVRIHVRSMIEASKGGQPGLFGDGSIGATAIMRRLPVITADKNFGSVLRQLGVEVRVP
jgi:RHS repeat-associated protein